MKLVYILGAGASAQAIPTYKDFNSWLSIYLQQLTHIVTKLNKLNPDPDVVLKSNHLFTKLESLLKECEYYGTADTLAVACRNDKPTLNLLKALISTFIYSQHFHLNTDHLSLYFEDFRGKKGHYGNQVDRRYIRFWASLLGGSENYIPDNIRFICWNYDFQIKASLHHFIKDEALIQHYIRTNVVYLNGSCLPNLNEPYNHQTSLHAGQLDNIINQLNAPDNTNLKFSWEKGSTSVNEALNLLKDADEIVWVGYSFPDYNRIVDLELIKNTLRKQHYIQDINPDVLVSKLQEIDASLGKHTKSISSIDGFYIPSKYFGEAERQLYHFATIR